MSLIDLLSLLAILPALLLLPGMLMLLLYTVFGLRRLPARKPDQLPLRGVVVVPAHNEEKNLLPTLQSLHQSARVLAEVVVIADHCHDRTAVVARSMGATVIERHSGARGKGAALADGFSQLLSRDRPPAWVAVVDADSVVSANFVPEVARAIANGAAAVQTRYTVNNRRGNWRARLMLLALAGFNCLRPRARQRLGWSAGLLGNGFALSLPTLHQVPHLANSLVEDSEYHLALIKAGRKVRFLDHVWVAADMPETAAAARSQRCRWEGGRLLLLRQAWQGWRQGHGTLESLLELLTLPVASQLLLTLLLLAIPGPARWLVAANLAAILLYTLASARIAALGWRDWRLLPAIVHYVFWKLTLLPAIWQTAREGRWVRTARKGEI